MADLQRLAEETPLRITAELTQLSREIGCAAPGYIPLMVEPEAQSDACVLNVMRAIRLCGGEFRYGWLLRECAGLWITAEFHAVRELDSGLLVDETPQEGPEDGGYVLFAPDRQYAVGFDFRKRPNPVRKRIYGAPGVVRPIRLDAPRRGLSAGIDQYLKVLSELDLILQPELRGCVCIDPHRFAMLRTKTEDLQRRLARLVEDHEKAGWL